MAPAGILISMATLTPTKRFLYSAAPLLPLAAAVFLAPCGLGRAFAQDVLLAPAFQAPVAGQPLPYNITNNGTDTVSICLTNGWSALGISGSSAFTVERRFGGKWHKVLGRDLRNQLAQPLSAGSTTKLAMAGLGESGTYRLELNYVHGLVPSCWAPHEGKIHVLRSDPFDLSDAPASLRTPTTATTPELKPRPE